MFKSELEVTTIHDVRTGFSNSAINLNPCRDCLYHGNCEGERYIDPGEYCRSRKEKTEGVE